MRALASLVCVLAVAALIGCASPKPAAMPITAASVGPPSPASERERERARKLIDKSIETGEAIKTTEGTKLICRKESITNTRLRSRKVCLTEEQWASRTDAAMEAFKEADRPGVPPTEQGPARGR